MTADDNSLNDWGPASLLPVTTIPLRVDDSTLQLHNKWLDSTDDRLYHFGISKSDTNCINKFSHIKVLFF